MFLLEKYKEKVAYSLDLCLKDLIFLTLRRVDIVLIFYISRCFGAYIIETGNAKKPQVDLEGKAYKGRVTALELDYNICEE